MTDEELNERFAQLKADREQNQIREEQRAAEIEALRHHHHKNRRDSARED